MTDSGSTGVDVLIVNWNSGEDLRRLLTDLLAQRGVSLTVTVVDNASIDGSHAAAHEFTNLAVRVVQAGRNLGYAAGNNLGFQHLDLSRPVLLLNPDISLTDTTAIMNLARSLEENPDLGAVGPMICRPDGSPEYITSVIDLGRARAVHIANGEAADVPLTEVRQAWIDGAAMLFRSDALASIGFFDERFFLFFEEVDWCMRAETAGWTVAISPGVAVTHRRSSSFAGSTKGAYYYWRNKYLLCSMRAAQPLRWRGHYLVQLLRFVASPAALRSGSSQRAIQGAFAALRGRFGPAPEDAA